MFEIFRQVLRKLDNSSLKKLEKPDRKYKTLGLRSILHYVRRQNFLDYVTVLAATSTLLVLSYQFWPVGENWYTMDFAKGTGSDLATVGGITIRSWGWVDQNKVEYQLHPVLFLEVPLPFSWWYALLPFTSLVAFLLAVLLIIPIVILVKDAIQNTHNIKDIIVPAQCTAICITAVTFAQIAFVLLGCLRVPEPSWSMKRLKTMTDQVLEGKRQDTIALGAGLISGWCSLIGCALWLGIGYGRYILWKEHGERLAGKWKKGKEKVRRRGGRKALEADLEGGQE